MKVLVPLNNKERMDAFISSGAGEFYVGFYDEMWEKRFGEYQDVNRMSGFKQKANCNSFEEVVELLQELKLRKIPTYITFNSSIYSQEQIAYMRGYFERLKEISADGVIVSCGELVQLAKQVGIPAVVSTIAGIYNSDIVSFYAELGAKRIILPRDVTVEEIRRMVEKHPKMEFEVFIMRNGCVFSDSNCLGLHRQETCSVCGSITEADARVITIGRSQAKEEAVFENDWHLRKSFHNEACGLCAVYDFVSMGISACKIVGRYDEWKSICQDIEFLCKNIEIAKTCKSRSEYLGRMIRSEGWLEQQCKDSFSCYYPELRF